MNLTLTESGGKYISRVEGVSEAKAQEDVHGISSVVEDTPSVVAGYGETAKREGAKTKEVRNVGLLLERFALRERLIICRLSSLQLSKRRRLSGGARPRFTFIVRTMNVERKSERLD